MVNVKNGTNIKTIINFIGTGIKTNTEIRKELCRVNGKFYTRGNYCVYFIPGNKPGYGIKSRNRILNRWERVLENGKVKGWKLTEKGLKLLNK